MIVFKKCAPELSSVLAKLFRLCVSKGSFPSCWKSASIVPVPKKGDLSSPANYRPISLLPVMSIIFETVVNNHILSFLESNGLLSDFQYGFRHQRSTADALAFLTEHIGKVLDKQGETRTVALDISKAFDRVWHKGLLEKLRSYGITGKVHQLLSSFLTNRQISVVLDGQKSASLPVNAGVPQGSVLGPTLFLVFINDLPKSVLSKMVMYADDTTLFNSHVGSLQNQQTVADQMCSDLKEIKKWGSEWLVTFNSSKTQTLLHSRLKKGAPMPVRMDESVLDESSLLSVLGISLSSDLSWKSYIESIGKQAAKRIGCLYRAKSFLPTEAVLHLYKAPVRPVMEYCCHL